MSPPRHAPPPLPTGPFDLDIPYGDFCKKMESEFGEAVSFSYQQFEGDKLGEVCKVKLGVVCPREEAAGVRDAREYTRQMVAVGPEHWWRGREGEW